MKPEVSIIMPAFNTEQYIEKSLKSVFSQTVKNYELIIVNDCSTDSTDELIKRMIKGRNNVKYLVNKSRKYAGATRNVGIKEAKSKYISFLDSDDIWQPNFLEEQLNLIKNNPYDIVSSDFSRRWIIFEYPYSKVSPSIKKKNLKFEDLLFESPVWTSTVVCKKKILNKVGGFNEKLRTGQDRDLWVRLYRSKCKFFINKNILATYVKHKGSISGSATKKDITFSIKNIKDYLKRYNLTCEEKKAVYYMLNELEKRKLSLKIKKELINKNYDSALKLLEKKNKEHGVENYNLKRTVLRFVPFLYGCSVFKIIKKKF